jgi:hypothetical protein
MIPPVIPQAGDPSTKGLNAGGAYSPRREIAVVLRHDVPMSRKLNHVPKPGSQTIFKGGA